MTSLPPSQRPRERLADRGAAALSDAELLAVVLGSGTRGRDVLTVAGELLGASGELRALADATDQELARVRGIGPTRALVLQAAFELGRRAAGSRPHRGRRLGHAADVWTHFRARLAHAPVEEFWCLGLDVRHRLQLELCAARGSLTGVEVHPRDVFRPLVRAGVAAVLFCHNHPSGDPTPSRQDVELTARLRQVGELCGITVLDHVVVAAEGYRSVGA
jgi:DNA repair protein RadC